MDNFNSKLEELYKNIMMDDIVDVILKADQYEYYDLKQRNIQKLKTILYTSKTADEARLLLNISNDFTKEEEEFYCHQTYWKIVPHIQSNINSIHTSIKHSSSYQTFIKSVVSSVQDISGEDMYLKTLDFKSLSQDHLNHLTKGYLEDHSKDLTIGDVLTNPMILRECGKHLYFFLRKRKLLKIIDETNITHCENCRCTFTMIYRKHHCRSCGKVFCYTCCHKKIDVPKEFLSYQQYSIFSYFSKEEKVCDSCYSEISEYHSCKLLIKFFQIIALEIPLLQRSATISKSWRKAVLFYLSFIREVQYKLLHHPLEDYESRFLYSNRYILTGHSSWMLQLIKSQSTDLVSNQNDTTSEILQHTKISNCWDCMCTRLCHSSLDIFDSFVILILENQYPISIQQGALEILKRSDKDNWIYFISFFFSRWSTKDQNDKSIDPDSTKMIKSISTQTISSSRTDISLYDCLGNIKSELNDGLFDFLIDLSKESPKIFTMLYWGFSVSSFGKSRRIYEHLKERLLLESPVFSKVFIRILNLLSYCEDYYQHQDKTILGKNLSKLANSCFCPIHPTKKIKKIFVDEIKIKQSITTPIYIPYECDDGTKSAILFKREDIRKDATAMAMAKLCKKLLEENNIQVPFISYDVVPTSPTSGFIEIVQQSKTLNEIFQEGTINNYLQIHNPEKKIGDILDNYMRSLAFWSIFTYLLGVGDRHLDNIMLTAGGILFHIDYGFVLGYETKPYVPLIRIDNAMIEGMGGNVHYDKFKSLCLEMFLCLRRYSSLLFCCFLTLASCDPPIQNTKFTLEILENHIVDRFLLGQSEGDVAMTISKLLDNSRDAVTLKVSDYIHTYANKIPTSRGIFSWFYTKK
jgi:phosphatidylinositol 3-kinase